MTLELRPFLSVLGALALVAVISEARVESVGGATATFDAVGPGGLNIHGSTPDLSATEKDGKVVVKVALANLTTGISLRDEHMRNNYLEVEKFPEAVVAVERSKLKFPAKGVNVRDQVPGAMTIHGVTRTVTLSYAAVARGEKIAVEGSAPIDLRDFGIRVPSYLGVGVDPHVKLKVHFKVIDR